MSTIDTQLIKAMAAQPTHEQLAQKVEDYGTLCIFIRHYSDSYIARCPGAHRRCSSTIGPVPAATRMAMLIFGVGEAYFTLTPVIGNAIYHATIKQEARA